VLGDSADNPRFVETLARRGYRFLVPVDRGENEAVAAVLAPATQIEEKGHRVAVSQVLDLSSGERLSKREWLAWILAGCLSVSLIAALMIANLRQPLEVRAFQFEVALPEKLNPTCPGPVVSPDGQNVAIVLGNEDQSRIWVHSLRSLDTYPLTGTEGGIVPSGHLTAARSDSHQNQALRRSVSRVDLRRPSATFHQMDRVRGTTMA